MTRRPDKASQVQIVVLGELTAEQRQLLEVCADAIGGKVCLPDSFGALRKITSSQPDRSTVLVLALKDGGVQRVIEVLAYLRKSGSEMPVVLLVGPGDAPYVPLMRELGVHQFVQSPLHGRELTDALQGALAEESPTSPNEAPPLTDEEKGVNIERLADDLNGRIRCGAGQGQVFLHSYVEGVDRKTIPRITLRCPLRTALHIESDVNYEHIRDVCCHAVDTCAVLRAYAALNGQTISEYLRRDSWEEHAMPDHAETPREGASTSASSSAVPSRSILDARPRHGLPDKDEFFKAVMRLGASSLLVKTGFRPRVRVGGKLRTLDVEILPNAQFEEKVFEFLSPEQQQRLMEEGSIDLAYDVPGSDRFRINIFRQESGLSMVARRVRRTIPSLEALNLPPIIERIAEYRQGLVLLAGLTGSGKSTTIAAMIEHINQTRADHIVTIEDPIKYLFTSKKCLINQREIGISVKDLPTALRALVHEDADVVLIGEMRDSETFRAALQAAETGRLVFGTVHAPGCAQTIGRLLDLFAEDERETARHSLVRNLRAIVAQKVLPGVKEGVPRVPATEVLLSIPTVQKLIVEGRDADLTEVIRGGEEGMRSFTDSMQWLIENGLIDVDTARATAPDPEELNRNRAGDLT